MNFTRCRGTLPDVSFKKVHENPSHANFHDSYDKLLGTLFPTESDFTIVPRFLPGPYDSPDFVFTFEVLLGSDSKLVFVLELKSPEDLQYFIWLLA